MDIANAAAIVQTVLAATLVGLTFAYVRTTGRQLKAMEDALEETRRSNKATEQSNEIAERTLVLGNRAWLAVNIVTVLDGGNFNGYNIEVTNLGKVPATDVRVWHRFDFWEDGNLPDLILPPAGYKAEGGFVIGAGVTHVITPPSETFMNYRRGPLHTFYCEATYSDFFDKPRKTVACWQYAEKTSVFNWREWTFAPKHNRME